MEATSLTSSFSQDVSQACLRPVGNSGGWGAVSSPLAPLWAHPQPPFSSGHPPAPPLTSSLARGFSAPAALFPGMWGLGAIFHYWFPVNHVWSENTRGAARSHGTWFHGLCLLLGEDSAATSEWPGGRRVCPTSLCSCRPCLHRP